MRKATMFLTAMAIAAAIWQAKAGATAGHDDPVLQSAKITFSLPRGDDKDDNTAIDVVVSTRVDGQWEEVIASLEDFANQEVWEDD